jgi:hypothetical protein
MSFRVPGSDQPHSDQPHSDQSPSRVDENEWVIFSPSRLPCLTTLPHSGTKDGPYRLMALRSLLGMPPGRLPCYLSHPAVQIYGGHPDAPFHRFRPVICTPYQPTQEGWQPLLNNNTYSTFGQGHGDMSCPSPASTNTRLDVDNPPCHQFAPSLSSSQLPVIPSVMKGLAMPTAPLQPNTSGVFCPPPQASARVTPLPAPTIVDTPNYNNSFGQVLAPFPSLRIHDADCGPGRDNWGTRPNATFEPNLTRLQERLVIEGAEPEAVALIPATFERGVTREALMAVKGPVKWGKRKSNEKVYLEFGGRWTNNDEPKTWCRLCGFHQSFPYKNEKDLLNHLCRKHFGIHIPSQSPSTFLPFLTHAFGFLSRGKEGQRDKVISSRL